MPTRITEATRATALRRPLAPSVIHDSDVPGLALHITSRRGFWAISYMPHGLNPRTGKRWGSTRLELGDAMTMTVAEVRSAALAAKAAVRAGRDPHRERLAARTSAMAARARSAIQPQTAADALRLYEQALMARHQPSATTRRQSVHYAKKSVRLMKAESAPLAAIDASAVRILIETMKGSDAERRHVFGALDRFLRWCVRQQSIALNPCDALDRSERPKPGRARAHVPTIVALRRIWNAVEAEPQRDLVRFLLLAPLRRNEASELRWSEVDLEAGCVRIDAERMKNHEEHILPLSAQAINLLGARPRGGEFVFPASSGEPFLGWNRLLKRIRAKAAAPKFRLHDIRRSFVSLLAHSFDVDALDQTLSHRRAGVKSVYQHCKRLPARLEAMQAWADLLLDQDSSNIVPFPRRADG
jgi:integrase